MAKKLKKAVKRGEVDVTIVNRTNNFLFTPLLHEVATGALNPRTVAEPLREIFVRTGIRILEGSIDSIDTAVQRVKISGVNRSVEIRYDYLVVATGAETNYYGIAGAEENALPLKTLRDASLIRNRVIDAFEQAILTDDPEERRGLLSFVVVGGGATGVEVAAELSDFISGMVGRYYGRLNCAGPNCSMDETSVTLIHAGKELLEQFSPRLRKAAHRHLCRMGVRIRLEASVTEVSKSGLTISGGEIISASTVIWCAGVRAAIPKFESQSPTLTGGRLAVDNHFRLLGSRNIFAMGDVAAYVDPYSASRKALPQLAQVAEGEAAAVARNVLASSRGDQLVEFRYESKGSMVSIGQWFAIGDIYSLHMSGRFTWWLWRTVYLFKFASWKKRIRIGFEWLLQAFFPRDITKIT